MEKEFVVGSHQAELLRDYRSNLSELISTEEGFSVGYFEWTIIRFLVVHAVQMAAERMALAARKNDLQAMVLAGHEVRQNLALLEDMDSRQG